MKTRILMRILKPFTKLLLVVICGLVPQILDGAIIFQDDFEGTDLKQWDEKVGTAKLVSDAPYSGRQCLEISKTLGSNTGGDLKKWFMPG
ncbi:MAG: hypothetical protein ACTHMT_06745, partial [Verrucomicrobiota bacterium]